MSKDDLKEIKQQRDMYLRAFMNLAKKYVIETQKSTVQELNGETYIADIDICALHVITEECRQAEKELSEEKK